MAVPLRHCPVPAVARPFRPLALQHREGIAPIVGAGHRRADHLHQPGVGRELRTRPDARSLRLRRPIRCGPYVAQAGIRDDREGPLFRPMRPDGSGFERRHLDRKTPWRMVKKYCEAAGIDPSRLGSRGIGIPRYAQRRSTTRSATGRRCTMCGSSPATPTSGRPSFTSSARKKTPRWRRGASRSG